MTEKIQYIINEIHSKCKDLHLQLENERSKNADLTLKINALEESQNNLETRNQELLSANEGLVKELELALKKDIQLTSIDAGSRDMEIDELVREIEHCITQLKHNNG